MNLSESLDYLEALAALGVRVGLDHTRHLAMRMGDPQRAYPCLIVGGTNGKGSTSSFLASILRASGFRVGLYTSPHLVDVRERVSVDGTLIAEEAFASCLTRVRQEAEASVARGELPAPPTYFEALTLSAFEHFRRSRVDVAVLEVGLGGRLDCTNIAEPVLSLVTNISLDHEDYLGQGLENIAREKAGIFRPGVPAFTAAAEGIALETLRRCARVLGTPLHALGECRLARGEGSWRLACGNQSAELPYPNLPGRHQIENAALAVRACWALMDLGWPVPVSALSEGIASARWPGRLELVGREPGLYLDGAHNPDGCRVLADFVTGLPQPNRALVFAVMKDKPAGDMLGLLLPLFGALWLTRVPVPRCMDPSELALAFPSPRIRVQEDPMRAVHEAAVWAGRDGVVVVAGSLYLVGFVKSAQERGGVSRSWGSGR